MGASSSELSLVYKKILKVVIDYCELVNKEKKKSRFSPKVKEQWRRKGVLHTFVLICVSCSQEWPLIKWKKSYMWQTV